MKNKFSPFWLVAFVLLASSFCLAQTAAKNLPVAGLKGNVTVRRDARAIPYIEATNDADLYFAQGYITASDRLWQMDILRRVSRGELAELFGKQVLDEDQRWRRYGFSRIAEESMTTLNPQLKKALEDYARGVNAYIATLDKDSLPPEFKILQYQPTPWKPTDTICIGKILADGLSSTWRDDLIRASLMKLDKEKIRDLTNNITPFDLILYGNDLNQGSTLGFQNQKQVQVTDADLQFAEKEAAVRKSSLEKVGLYAEDLAASNNWVISGKRTADGKAILANDPHLQPAAPGIWYLTHLSTPDMRVSGVTFPGVPGIVLGHNAEIAWGATNVGPDVQDLYRETFNDKGEYKTPNGWEKIVVRKEEIKVRPNLLSPVTETQVLEVEETRNGTIITDEVGQKFALKWTARDPKNQEFEAFFKLNRAKNWTDFQTALKTYGGASQNFVYADVKGNIGWWAAGRIPIRRLGNGSLLYDGATNEGDWVSYIPFEELPHLYNPKEGFIVTANQRTVGTDYKYFSEITRDAANPWRARRIYDLLKNNTKVTMDDVRDIQHDVYSTVHKDLAGEIIKRNAASPETLAVLKDWDGKMTAGSKPALIVNEIRNCIAQKISWGYNIPRQLVQERLLYWVVKDQSARWLPPDFASYTDVLKTCDSEVRAALTKSKSYGADEASWRWGKMFETNFFHPLSLAPLIGGQFAVKAVNVSGSGTTPNVGTYVSMRHIASPGNWDATRHVIPLGQSGDPNSPHWKDQFEAWRTGAPMIFPFTKTAVEKNANEVWILEAKK
ncbi:MAG TPA: penicillin acylase family protein [Pyrinomonadaceae bacterium]|nr:penicillin acylase family protein [Pyrinomonadaceae bacterium]